MITKSKEEIEIDFCRAVASAQELEGIANDLTRIAGSYTDGAVLTLKNNWKGENGEKFERYSNVLSNDMYETAEDIIKVAKNIRNTADIVYKAEKKAAGMCF